MKKYNKYSLSEKRSYWGSVADKYFDILSGQGTPKRKLTKEEKQKIDYAQGFLLSSKRGRISTNFNELDYSSQIGQIKGFKSKKNEK